jgi:hypothetical protein
MPDIEVTIVQNEVLEVRLGTPQGISGPPGPSGSVVRFGAGVPSNSLGADGDVYWDTTNGRVYARAAGVYTLQQALSAGGGSDAHYVHTQGVAQSVWVVAHAMGKRPAITVIDSAGDVVFGDIRHDSVNQATLTFAAPFSGTAFCN